MKKLSHNIFWILENFSRGEKLKNYFSKERLKIQADLINELKNSGKGKKLNYKIFETLSKKEFSEMYFKYEPFVIKGGANNWECVGKWNLDYFQSEFGDIEVPFLDYRQKDESTFEKSTFKKAIDEFKRGSKKYCKFADTLYRIPELQNDLDMDFLNSLKPKINQTGTYQFFLGPGTTSTRLHNALGNNFFVQIHGKKVWKIYPLKYTSLFSPLVTGTPHFICTEGFSFPDEHTEVGDRLDYWEIELEPGDILFNPSYLWHTVYNTTDSIAVKCSWTSLLSFTRTYTMSFLTLASFGGGLLSLKQKLKMGKFSPKKIWM